MTKGRQTVEAIVADLGLSTVAAKTVHKEVRSFRKLYAAQYGLVLTWDVMQDSSSNYVEDMARIYFEDGLPRNGIHPGRSRWTADMSAAQREQAEYPIPKSMILESLQILIAHLNWNSKRKSKNVAPRKDTSSPISSDSEQTSAMTPTQGRGQCGTRKGLRSSDRLYPDEGSTEYLQIAPVAMMKPEFGTLDSTNGHTYGGLPEFVDLETYGDKEAMTPVLKGDSDLMQDNHQVPVEATPGGISASNNQAPVSGPADLSPASQESPGNTDDIHHQQCPSQDNSSDSQLRTEDSSSGQTTMVGPYQRQSKVIVLKWKQRKRQATEDGIPHLGSTKDSSSVAAVSQNDGLDEGTKRRRLGDMDSIPTLPQPVDITYTTNSDAGNPSNICEPPAVETRQSAHFHTTISKLPDGGADSLNPNEQSPRTGGETPSISNKAREQEQAHQGSGDSEVGLQWSSWLLDPRKPGGALRLWPGNNPFSQTIHYVFEKTTELLETDRYSGIQFLFEFDNHPGEVTFQVTKGALAEFQSMKKHVRRGLKKMVKGSKKKVTEVDITMQPFGLAEVGSVVGAVAATVEDQDLDGIDALFG